MSIASTANRKKSVSFRESCQRKNVFRSSLTPRNQVSSIAGLSRSGPTRLRGSVSGARNIRWPRILRRKYVSQSSLAPGGRGDGFLGGFGGFGADGDGHDERAHYRLLGRIGAEGEGDGDERADRRATRGHDQRRGLLPDQLPAHRLLQSDGGTAGLQDHRKEGCGDRAEQEHGF